MNTLLSEMDVSNLVTLGADWGVKILLALVTLVVGWKLAGWLGKLMEKQLIRRGVDETVRPFICTLISTLARAGVVVSAIETVGIQATSFAAIFAAMGLAIGMALSGTLQNFAGGVILLILRPFKVGDVIEAQGYTAKVKEIQIFQTILLTPDNKMIHIPNGKLSNDSLTNYSTMTERRIELIFGIGYDDCIDKAREVIKRVIDANPAVIQEEARKPLIAVSQLGDSSVNFTVRVWVKAADYWDVNFATIEQVKKAFDAEGISIPFPQQDLHLHKVN